MLIEKSVIYPIEENIYPFIEYIQKRKNLNYIYWCVLNNWFTCGKEIQFGKSNVLLRSVDDVLEIENYDNIIIINSNKEIEFGFLIAPILRKTESKNKKIYFTNELNNCERKFLKDNGIVFEVIQGVEPIINDFSDQRILKIDTPVIFVLGMFENTEKLKTTLYVHDYLSEHAYKVKTILTKDNILGIENCYSFPNIMFSKDYSDAQKIVYFNHFVRKIDVSDRPDVIVVGIPGEIMPLNEIHGGNFGSMSFIVSNAIKSDYAILNIFGNFVNNDFIEQMKFFADNKYSISLNAFMISNIIIDPFSISENTLKFYRQEQTCIEQGFYYNGKNSNENELGEDIINSLSKNSMLTQI